LNSIDDYSVINFLVTLYFYEKSFLANAYLLLLWGFLSQKVFRQNYRGVNTIGHTMYKFFVCDVCIEFVEETM